jgi:hypothetical protein
MASPAPEEFLARVVLPLVAGGEVAVGRPLDRKRTGVLLAAARARSLDATDVGSAITRARAAVAGELVLAPPPLPLDEEAIQLCVALYGALALSHPDLRRAGAAVRARLAALAERAAMLPAAHGRRDLLNRHTLCHNLFRVVRTDRRLHFWLGTVLYRGREPPPRALRWKKWRRVQVETARLNWYGETGVPASARKLVARILAASPLTDLLHPLRAEPPLGLLAAARAGVLSDPELARVVTYSMLALGVPTIAVPLGAAMRALPSEAERSDGGAAALVLALVCHLHVLDATLDPESSWIVGETAAQPGTRDFAAMFPACWRAGFVPPGAREQPALREALARRAERCAQAVGEERVAFYARLLTLARPDAAEPAATLS